MQDYIFTSGHNVHINLYHYHNYTKINVTYTSNGVFSHFWAILYNGSNVICQMIDLYHDCCIIVQRADVLQPYDILFSLNT